MVPRTQMAAYTWTMIAAIISAAKAAWSRAPRRTTPIGKLAEKYARQITMPDTNSTSMATPRNQNSSFCPPLYLPISGMLWSSPLTISLARFTHSQSASRMRLRPWKRKNITTKNSIITTPMKGCRMRVQVPPPKSMVSGNSAGWNRDSPESASRMKQMPVTQWLARSEAV